MKIALVKKILSNSSLLLTILFTSKAVALETSIKKIDLKKEIVTLDNKVKNIETGDLIKVSGNCVLEVYEVRSKTVRARSELCIQKEDIVVGKIVVVEKISSDSQTLTQVDTQVSPVQKQSDSVTPAQLEKKSTPAKNTKTPSQTKKSLSLESNKEEPIEDILKKYSNFKRQLSEKWVLIGSVSNMVSSVESQNQLSRLTTVEEESSLLMGAGIGYNHIPVEGWGYQAQAHFLISDSNADFSKFLRFELSGIYGTSEIYFMRAGFNLLKSISDMSEPVGFGTQVGLGAQLNKKTAFILSYTQSIIKEQKTRNQIEYEVSNQWSGLELQWNYAYDIFGR